MINAQTVFILGAGAHVSYGFPVGKKLKQDIVSLVAPDETRSSKRDDFWVTATMYYGDVDLNNCRNFAMALDNAGQSSIDAFLNSNRHRCGFDLIGKAAIAKIILEYEKNACFGGSDDWMDYLFQIMCEGVNSLQDFLDNNKISFITFNYDRFLERFLYSRLKNSFGVTSEVATTALKVIPIHHVYGSLGDGNEGAETGINGWVQSARGIKTIFDGEHDSAAIKSSKILLENCERICLLGFGFHRENIQILDLPKLVLKEGRLTYCTRFGLTEAEWDRLTQPFNGARINPAHGTLQCLEALRHLPIFS